MGKRKFFLCPCLLRNRVVFDYSNESSSSHVDLYGMISLRPSRVCPSSPCVLWGVVPLFVLPELFLR